MLLILFRLTWIFSLYFTHAPKKPEFSVQMRVKTFKKRIKIFAELRLS